MRPKRTRPNAPRSPARLRPRRPARPACRWDRLRRAPFRHPRRETPNRRRPSTRPAPIRSCRRSASARPPGRNAHRRRSTAFQRPLRAARLGTRGSLTRSQRDAAPAASHPAHRPLAKGIAAALPFLDAFVSGHNLRTLDAVADAIDGSAPDAGLRRDRRTLELRSANGRAAGSYVALWSSTLLVEFERTLATMRSGATSKRSWRHEYVPKPAVAVRSSVI
jgi:hypothetical protein